MASICLDKRSSAAATVILPITARPLRLAYYDIVIPNTTLD